MGFETTRSSEVRYEYSWIVARNRGKTFDGICICIKDEINEEGCQEEENLEKAFTSLVDAIFWV